MPLIPTHWLHLAILSGLFAATNALFAKLTTADHTTALSLSLARLLGLSSENATNTFEYLLRAACFGLNLAFNAIMWALFTAALRTSSSATRVSVVNISANFVATAIMGWGVFGEGLPLMWWAGAGLLVVGSVIISRKDNEKKKAEVGGTGGYEVVAGDESEEELGGGVELSSASGSESEGGGETRGRTPERT